MGRTRWGHAVAALVALVVLGACGGSGSSGDSLPVFTTLRDQNVWEETSDGAGWAGPFDSAQTFTVGASGSLQFVVLQLRQVLPGDLYFDIRPLDGSRPHAADATALRQAVVPSGTLPDTFVAHTINVSPPLPVTVGQRLAICLRSPAGDYRWAYVTDSSYDRGGRHSRSATPADQTWNPVAADHMFQTWVER